MPFGLCNAPGTFQRCVMSIFTDLIDKIMEVFMDDFTVYGRDGILMTVWPILRLFYSVVLKLIWYSIGRSVISWFKRVLSSVIWFPREETKSLHLPLSHYTFSSYQSLNYLCYPRTCYLFFCGKFPSLWHIHCYTACFHSLLNRIRPAVSLKCLLRYHVRLVCQVCSIAFEIGSQRSLPPLRSCLEGGNWQE
uniref:Reverse transcriptase domain-containing protein n=1 Tax=Chrysopogon zizanioides TaxID=167337 RepID=A0A7T3RB71_9POAL|nr:hypothetical protein KQ334_mgp015 [Chrysopogon zizanioides]QPZ94380.1 hypothetical protein [Chrysopogon zizanioides]